jgi:hypothetical protein
MTSLAGALLAEAQRLVEPLVVAGRVDAGAEMLLALVGQTADAAGDPGLAAALTDLSQAASALTALQDDDLDSWSGLEAVADAARKATTALAALEQAVSDPGLAHRLEGLGVDLTGQLTGVYLRRFHARLFRLAAILTLISPAEFHAPEEPVMDGATVVRRTWFRDELHFDRIDPLLNQPWPTLRDAYAPNDLASAADAHVAAALLFPMIGALLDAIHLPWSIDRRELSPPPPDAATSTDPSADDGDADTGGFPDPGDLPDPPPDPDPVDLTPFYLGFVPRLTIRIPQLQADGSLSGTFLGVAVEAWSAAHPGNTPGLVVALTGALDWTATSGDWAVSVASRGEVPAFVIGPNGMSLGPGISGADASVSVTAARQPPAGGGAAFVLGSPAGSRLELGSLKAGLDLTLATSGLDLAIALAASSGKLVIKPGDADGFLAMILPADGLTATFDVGAIISASRGVELNGGAGLEVSRPVHISLGSVGSVDALVASVGVGGDGLHIGFGAGLTLRLGPIGISVDHVGVSSTVTFPAGGGNLGSLDVATGFAGPTGLGLSLSLGNVSGSGALILDPAHGRYLGGLDISVSGLFDLRLLGVLETRSAGGGPGFSLILMGIATFPGIPVGLGFEINRAGGLIAINRRLDTTAVVAALAAGTLGTILDPGADVLPAVTALERILPAADGSYVGGVMIGLTWGEPALARITVALLYDTSSPLQLTMLGTVSVLLPEQSPLIKINVDIVGRFRADPFAIDVLSSMRDSTLAGMLLSGDTALQLHIGGDSLFLLSLGGFHPSFTPPAGLANLRRLSLALPSNPELQLSLTGYFAVTSNTLQFGASLHFWAGIHDVLGVAGDGSFDALIDWDPLHFEAALNVDVHVEVAGDTLFGARLKGSLSGPGPWHVEGGVYVEALWWEAKVYEVDTDFGSSPALPAPDAVDPAAMVADALQSSSSWSGSAPATGVLLSASAGPGSGGGTGSGDGTMLMSPSAVLAFSQDRVPLGLLLDRVGGAPVGDTRTVTLGPASIDGVAAGTDSLDGSFAPAQFLDLSDDEALSRPSFERMPAGLSLRAADAADPASFARPDVLAFEIIPPPAPSQPSQPTGPLTGVMGWQTATPIMTAAWAAPASPVGLRRAAFQIASSQTLIRDDALTPAAGFTSRTLALQALVAAGAQAANLQVTEVS